MGNQGTVSLQNLQHHLKAVSSGQCGDGFSLSVKYAAEVALPVAFLASQETQYSLILGEFCWKFVGLKEGKTGISGFPQLVWF